MTFFLLLFSFGLPYCQEGVNGCVRCNSGGDQCAQCQYPEYVLTDGPFYFCICNTDQHYHNDHNTCTLAQKCTTSDVEFCEYCIGNKCVECDSERHMVLMNDECGCYSDYHLEDGDEPNTCKCEQGYGFNLKGKCEEIDYTGAGGGHGCIESVGSTYFTKTCVKCNEHFILTKGESTHTCVCEENYILDPISNNKNESRCLPLFPETCREGCICDKNNQICLSCKENYIPQYYNDQTTIANCIPTAECPSTAPENCVRCNKDQVCIECKDGLYYLPSQNKCVERTIFDGSNYIIGCIYGESSRCELCEKEYNLYQSSNMKASCYLYSASANPSLYADLQTVSPNAISEKDDQIEFNLDEIEERKQRPYSYTLKNAIPKVLIDNDNSIDFAIEISYSMNDEDALTIGSLSESKPNPPVTILGYSYNIKLQTTKASLFDPSSAGLSSDNEIIELDKVTLNTQSSQLFVDKNVQINELHSYGSHEFELTSSTEARDAIQLEQKITTLHIHQGSELTLKNDSDIDTIIFETGARLILSDSNLTVKHLHVKMAVASFPDIYNLIQGNLVGVPESITLDLRPNDTFVYEMKDYNNFCKLQLAQGENPEFVQNCKQWAKVYNDHPTDGIYNFAECQSYTSMAILRVVHNDNNNQGGGNGGGGGSDAGMIAGIVIGVIVVVAVAIVLVYFFVIKPKQAAHNSSANEDNMKENGAEVA